MDAFGAHVPGKISPHNDVFALAEVFDVHHAPHEGKAKRGERENCADKHTIDQELDVQEWRQHQEIYIIEHDEFPLTAKELSV
jgi:hypothetical protein